MVQNKRTRRNRVRSQIRFNSSHKKSQYSWKLAMNISSREITKNITLRLSISSYNLRRLIHVTGVHGGHRTYTSISLTAIVNCFPNSESAVTLPPCKIIFCWGGVCIGVALPRTEVGRGRLNSGDDVDGNRTQKVF